MEQTANERKRKHLLSSRAQSRLQRSGRSPRGQAFNPVAIVFTELCEVLPLRFAPFRMTLRSLTDLHLRLFHVAPSAKRCAPIRGGFNRCSYLSDFRRSSCIRRGPHFREKTISLVITSRRFIHRNFSAIRPTVGLDRNRHGGLPGSCSRRLFLFFGLRADSGSLVTTIVARTTKPFGLIRLHAP